MIKVIHCITTIERGGAEKQLLILVREQIKAGMEVTIIHLKGREELKNDFLIAGAKVVDTYNGKILLWQIYKLRKALKNQKIILHAHLPRAELISMIAHGKSVFIISRHNAEKFFPKAPYSVSRILSLFVTRRVDKCIAISEAVKFFIIDRGEIKDLNKIIVIHYAYDSNFTYNPKFKVKNKVFNIGTIGRLVLQKDQITLLKAFYQFLTICPNATLTVVGNGNLKNKLQKFCGENSIQNKVLWIEKTSDSYRNLYGMDLFVLPSKYEGFGLVLLEAMQVNLPIIAANNSAIPEVLGNNYKGLFSTGDVQDLVSKMELFYNQSKIMDLSLIHTSKLNKFNPIIMNKKISGVYRSFLINQ